jgi:hypothetical protein
MHSTPQPVTPLTSHEPIPARFAWTGSGPLALHAGAIRHQREVAGLVPRTGLENSRGISGNSGRKSPAPVAATCGRSGHFGTLWERPAGTQTHSRRTGRKLGQLRCTRQGLVRESESNTKYGGKRGKTGVGAAPVMGPSISESSGIPKRKKDSSTCGFWLRPAVHREVFIRGRPLHCRDSPNAMGRHVRASLVLRCNRRQAAADSLPVTPP